MLDWQGGLQAVVGSARSPSDTELRRHQEKMDTAAHIQAARLLITEKIRASLEALAVLPPSLLVKFAESKVRSELDALLPNRLLTIDTIRLAEARAALAYFGAWEQVPIRWKGLDRQPVPAEWLSIGLRQSLNGSSNRNATHPVNAMLNYGYSILEARVRVEAISAGLDIERGALHASRPGRGALVLDLMEPLRPVVDRYVLGIVRSHVFSRKDFAITSGGVCRLHPQLARSVSALQLSEEVVSRSVERFVAELRLLVNGALL
jgi:CRISP-associated protein Cas1